MKKSDLKTGMLIQIQNGRVYLVVDEFAISNSNTWFELNSNKEDLTYSNPDFNINKVSRILINYKLMPKYWTEETLNNNLLWERSTIETIEIAGQKFNKEEVENALKDLKPIK